MLYGKARHQVMSDLLGGVATIENRFTMENTQWTSCEP